MAVGVPPALVEKLIKEPNQSVLCSWSCSLPWESGTVLDIGVHVAVLAMMVRQCHRRNGKCRA